MAVWDVTGGKDTFKKYFQIGTHCVVFPNITIGESSVVGACSMVRHNTEPWTIYVGIPAHKLKERSRELINKLY